MPNVIVVNNNTVTVVKPPASTQFVVSPTGNTRIIVAPGEQGPAGVGTVGPQGPPGVGVAGPQGPPGVGASTAEMSYIHTQLSAASVWDITYPMLFQPAISVIDSGGTEVVGDIQRITLGHLTVTFSAPFSGIAYLS